MSVSPFFVEILGQQHDRSRFACGEITLDRYFRELAGQDVRRNLTVVQVLVERASGTVAGYYTLANTSLALEQLPEDLSRKLPRYPMIPATLLGRLAIDLRFRGQGLGQVLLTDALHRSWETSLNIASFAVVVDASNECARNFYMHFGFIPLNHEGDRTVGERPLTSVPRPSVQCAGFCLFPACGQ